MVNVHYLADALEAHLKNRVEGIEIAVSDEREQLLETGGGLVRALPLIDADPFLVVNSDNLWIDGPVDSLRLLASQLGRGADGRAAAARAARPRQLPQGPGRFPHERRPARSGAASRAASRRSSTPASRWSRSGCSTASCPTGLLDQPAVGPGDRRGPLLRRRPPGPVVRHRRAGQHPQGRGDAWAAPEPLDFNLPRRELPRAPRRLHHPAAPRLRRRARGRADRALRPRRHGPGAGHRPRPQQPRRARRSPTPSSGARAAACCCRGWCRSAIPSWTSGSAARSSRSGTARTMPPAIEPLERLMLLARLVQQHLGGVDAAEALRLAEDLARTLDQLLIEEVDPARLRDFAADLPDLSLHWQKSLERLAADPRPMAAPARASAAGSTSPTAATGCSTAVAAALARRAAAGLRRRRRHHHRRARRRRLLAHRRPARPTGMVVFPGLDLDMPEEEWEALGPHEPDEATGRRRRSIETHPAIPPQAAARPDGRRPGRGRALALGRRPRRAGGAQPGHRQRDGARRLHRPMAGPAPGRAAPDRRARARAGRSGRGGAGDRASRCARRWRSRAGPPPWSRPTAASPGGSRPICGAGASRPTTAPAGRSRRRRPAPCCSRSPPPRPSGSRRCRCSPCSSIRW